MYVKYLYLTIQSLVIVTDPTQFPRSERLINKLSLGMIFDVYSLARISQNIIDPSSLAETIVSSLWNYMYISKFYSIYK